MKALYSNDFHRLYDRIRNDLTTDYFGNEETISMVSASAALHMVARKRGHATVSPRHLLVGPSSSGKTHIAMATAKVLGIPFGIISGAVTTAEGFKGTTITDGLAGLAKALSGKKRRQGLGGLLFVDEMDGFIRRQPGEGLYEAALYSLLPILGGESVSTSCDTTRSPVELKTNEILVLIAGVFPEICKSKWNSLSTAADALVDYGFPVELISRISHISALQPLKIQEAMQAIEKQVNELGLLYGIKNPSVVLGHGFLRGLANEVIKSKYGLRFCKGFLHKRFMELIGHGHTTGGKSRQYLSSKVIALPTSRRMRA